MKTRLPVLMLALTLLSGCMDPAGTSQLDAELKAVKERIAQAQEERQSHGKGSVMHDLVSLRIAIHEQTLAMLEQRRASDSWRTKLNYTVNGKPYTAPADAEKRVSQLEARIRKTQAGRESDLQQARDSGEAVKPLYTMSAGTRAILISQLEYQLAAHRHGFPPYYVPFSPPKPGTTRPQIIEVPAGKSAVVQ